MPKAALTGTVLAGALLLVSALGPAAAWAEAPEEKLDCRVYETKKGSVAIGLKVGNLLFSVGPEITYALERGVAWDQAVYGIIVRYVELCNRYNAGLVSKAEYEQRLRDIDEIYQEAQRLQAKLVEATRTRAGMAHGELDEVFGPKPPAGSPAPATPENVALQESVEGLAKRIDQLDPIGRPLARPPDPVKPGGITGSVGASPEPAPATP